MIGRGNGRPMRCASGHWAKNTIQNQIKPHLFQQALQKNNGVFARINIHIKNALLGKPGLAREIGGAIAETAEVFTPNATKAMELGHEAYRAALSQYGVEFQNGGLTWFDRFVNGLNRLPRPALAIGTLGLFVFAMAAPQDFAARMEGLALVPDPLWWLLGAIVSFYFGARELHHVRRRQDRPAIAERPRADEDTNPALEDWSLPRGER